MGKLKIYDRNLRVNAVKLGLETNLSKVAKELGIAPTNIYRWQKELQKYGKESFCGPGRFRNPEQKRFSELKRTLKQKLKETQLEIEIFKKSSKYISEGKPMIFHFIENNLNTYPLWRMCKVLGIRDYTYYRWKNHVISPRQHQTILLEEEITSIFHEYKGIYGNVKISAELQSRGFKLSRAQVTFYMKKLGLTSKVRRRDKATSSKFYNPYVFPNVLNRQFKAEEPSQVWVSGITIIETATGFLFLTIIIDLFDKKIIGWSLSNGSTIKETSIPSWEMAVHNRKIKKGLIFHSDRSPQYANKLFTHKLNSYKEVRQSMSRTRNHLDNIIPKNFFTSFRSELMASNILLTKKQIEEKIFEHVENRH
ncbi:IS3 family transposase [Flavobacterium sp. B183]|uniref:IS3 family transposase n=1 Tax=Flavobacterium sp. B183 TaxID=907046 RepID=UPI00201F969B|nr:IS3 family transposase [Flavobacterium sp. B183]URC11680.1 IS3 family transposase [Flavobacterium sp. B183]